MNIIRQSAEFAEHLGDLLRWVKQCGHLPVINKVENLTAQIQLYLYDCTQLTDENIAKEMKQYWCGLSPLNRFKFESNTLIFERKETE